MKSSYEYEFNLLDQCQEDSQQNAPSCSHIYISTQGAVKCSICNYEPQDNFAKTGWKTTYNKFSRNLMVEKTIYNDIEGLGLNDEIITIANAIYQKCCNGVIRGKTRKGVICTCIYYASNICPTCCYAILHNEMGDPVRCTCNQLLHKRAGALCFDEVIRIFKIGKKVALKGFKYVNSVNNFSFTSFVTTPETYISIFLKKLSISDERIKEIVADFAKLKHIKLSSEPRPQSIAAAYIYHWVQKNNKGIIKLDNIAVITQVSQLTIEKLEKELRERAAAE